MDSIKRDEKAAAAAERDGIAQAAVSATEKSLLKPGDDGYDEELADIREKVHTGIDQIARGEVVPAEEVFGELRRRVRDIGQQVE